MKVFDFDNTLYRGESPIDLVLFMMKKDKKILLWLPKIFFNLFKYKLCILNKEQLENKINELMHDLLKDKDKTAEIINSFWSQNYKKLNQVTLKEVAPEDVILSASPSLLLDGIKEKLISQNIVCSEIDIDKKKITYLNFGENKVKRFKEIYGDKKIDAFYTDSYNDKAMMEISDKVFLVRKNKIIQIK